MSLVADEGVERHIVERLRESGHQVLYVAESSPSVDDEWVLADALRKVALLLTNDMYKSESVLTGNVQIGRAHV